MEKQRLFKISLSVAAGAVGLWLFTSWLLPVFLPFLLAFLLAAVTEPPANYLMKKTGMPRPLAGGLCILGAYLLLAGLLFLLGRTLFRELGEFLSGLPRMLQHMTGPMEKLHAQLRNLTRKLPEGVAAALTDMVDDFFSGSSGLAQELPGKMLSFATKVARKIPDLVLFLLTTVVASFMTAGVLPQLRKWLSRVLPAAWRKRVTRLWQKSRGAVGLWLKAELKLVGVTFVVVTAGLFLLRVPYPLLLGVVIAVVDLLPVFGVGTVLVPWSIVRFLQGDTAMGIALLALYAVAYLTRTILEPRILGKQMGIPPLLTLAAAYTGYRLAGLWGLILFPVAVSIAFEFFRRTSGKTDTPD